MKIWIDGDACPAFIKQLLYKTAERRRICVTLVANQPMRVPTSSLVDFLLVGAGQDVADQAIIDEATAGDLVISNDVPLASEVIAKGCKVLNSRGDLLDTDNIGSRLSMRDFMDELRSTGVQTGGPPPLNKKDRQLFTNALDRLLAQMTQ